MIFTIAWYEFWFAVKKKSYYLVTFGMPLLVLGYIGLLSLIILAAAPGEIKKRNMHSGVIDRSGILTASGGPLAEAELGKTFTIQGTPNNEAVKAAQEMPPQLSQMVQDIAGLDRKVMVFSSLEDADEHFENETLRAVVEIPADYIESGKFNVYVERSDLLGSSTGTSWLAKMIGNELLKKTQLSDAEIARVRKSAVVTQYEMGENSEFEEVDSIAKALTMGIPLAVAGLLMVALMMNASLLLASIAEEKENKVMEVLVSSVSADTLLFGKVLGIVVAGLIQIVVWMAMVSVIPGTIVFMVREQIDYDVNVVQLMISVAFMMMGFLFYGCLLAGMGSLGSTYKDCQQLSAVVIICACMPMMMWMLFLSDPNAIAPRVVSFVPLFSPVAMSMRLGAGEIPIWETAVSFLILIGSTWVAVKVSARLFRAGTLMQGKPPGPRMIWKALRQG